MPERSEIKLMSDFINQFKEVDFYRIEKSSESKLKDPNINETTPFRITALSRGKELRLTFSNHLEDMSMSMGMSGCWHFVEADKLPKHSHLRFYGKHNNLDFCLVMQDARRFAKYKWVPKDWNSNRGPDPVDEYDLFVQKVQNAPEKYLKSRLNEVLMDQSLFNGVGNYLRAEILYRMNCSPFITLDSIFNKIDHVNQEDPFMRLCISVKSCMEESYILGGGQIKDFKNPFGVSASGFKDWLKAYNKGVSVIDNTGRRFWFDPKYLTEAKEIYADK